MKRLILESIKVMYYALAQPVDRLGALSGVLGIQVSAAADNSIATVTVSHSDTEGGTYAPVLDERMFLGNTHVTRDDDGKIVKVFLPTLVSAGDLLNVDIDLIGCKQFVKINVEYTADGAPASVTAAYALALGDFDRTPPEA